MSIDESYFHDGTEDDQPHAQSPETPLVAASRGEATATTATATAPAAEPPAAASDDLDALSFNELRRLAKIRGVNSRGKKADLLRALRA